MNSGFYLNSSLSDTDQSLYLSRQLNNFFPDNKPVQPEILTMYVNDVNSRVLRCFSRICKKYFNENGTVCFNHLHSDQYCMYLYMLSNLIYEKYKDVELATKLYYLNKALHSVDIYFTTKLPDIFLFVHPIGSILGRAEFSDYFIMYQGCTVGCLNEGIFPVFKGKTIMYSNSQIMGKCTIGDNVCIASGISVINTDVPDNTIVMGTYPDYIFKENKKPVFERPPFKYNKY